MSTYEPGLPKVLSVVDPAVVTLCPLTYTFPPVCAWWLTATRSLAGTCDGKTLIIAVVCAVPAFGSVCDWYDTDENPAKTCLLVIV